MTTELDVFPSAKPVVLIVEDKERALKSRRQFFEARGFYAIGAKSKEAAVREFESAPAIDLVVTDIDLDPAEGNDRSGIELAKTFKRERPGLPIVAYSAHVAEKDLGAADWAQFDDHVPIPESGKKQFFNDEFEARVESWKAHAIAYRDERWRSALEELQRIKQKYHILGRDLQTIRDCLPGSHLPSTAAEHIHSSGTADELIRASGYRLHLVASGEVRPTNTGHDVRTAATIPMWIRTEAEDTVAELYGFPSLYGVGPDTESALADLLLLMDGFYEDFCETPSFKLSKELRRTRDYLCTVFGHRLDAPDEESSD